MEREVWVRAGMVSTILVLAALVLVTPNLMGQPTPLSSLPILIVAMTPDKAALVVDVTAVQPYLYANVTLDVEAIAYGNQTVARVARADAYSATVWLPSNGTAGLPANGTSLWVHARLVDQMGNLYEDNVTVRVSRTPPATLVMSFTFPSDPGTGPITRTVPDDFRWAIPRRGTIPGMV